MKTYEFLPTTGKIHVLERVKIRKNFPSSGEGEKLRVAKPKEVFDFVGMILNGEEVDENPKWYLLRDGTYIWAGCVTEQTSAEPILGKPLASLLCTQRFGDRPWYYEDLGSPKGHNGLDFRTWVNGNPKKWKQPVYSVLDGTILESAYKKYLGNYVRINHANKWQSVYLHLDSRSAKVGDKVSKGQEIGISGITETDAPHLHFGFRLLNYDKTNGYMGYINPTLYFESKVKFVKK